MKEVWQRVDNKRKVCFFTTLLWCKFDPSHFESTCLWKCVQTMQFFTQSLCHRQKLVCLCVSSLWQNSWCGCFFLIMVQWSFNQSQVEHVCSSFAGLKKVSENKNKGTILGAVLVGHTGLFHTWQLRTMKMVGAKQITTRPWLRWSSRKTEKCNQWDYCLWYISNGATN